MLVSGCILVTPWHLMVVVMRDRGPLARCSGLSGGHRELEEDRLRHDGEDGEPDDCMPRDLWARGATPRSC
jgi:hypothetical protein